jgi:murein DD-endopeptidase MepM/ murein hydrolase activator NlpD
VVLAEIVPIFIFVTIPFSVHAGFFSTLLSFIGERAISDEEVAVEEPVTKEVRLLSSRINPDPKAALGGGDIIVNEDGTLVSGGPFGEDKLYEDSLSDGEISIYMVREGDSLSQIAEMFDVTTNTILWANELSGAKSIRPGQELVILPITGVSHVVKDGDTLSNIAKKYESDMDEILSYNQLTVADELSIGLTLIIPGGNMHEAAPKRVVQSSATPTKVSGAVSSGGGLINPLPGGVRTQGIHGYNGVDLAASIGSRIQAAASGEVIVSKSSGWNGGYGNYVVVKHGNGTQTLYAHMSSNAVAVGAKVGAGDTVGYVGNTGRSTGAHLHFEVRGGRNPF